MLRFHTRYGACCAPIISLLLYQQSLFSTHQVNAIIYSSIEPLDYKVPRLYRLAYACRLIINYRGIGTHEVHSLYGEFLICP